MQLTVLSPRPRRWHTCFTNETARNFRPGQTHFYSCTWRFASQVCPYSCIDYRRSFYSRLNTACRLPSLLCEKDPADSFGVIGMGQQIANFAGLGFTSPSTWSFSERHARPNRPPGAQTFTIPLRRAPPLPQGVGEVVSK